MNYHETNVFIKDIKNIYRKEEGEKKYELYFIQLEDLNNDICLRKKYFSHTY